VGLDTSSFGGPLTTTMYAETAPLRPRQFRGRDHHPHLAENKAKGRDPWA
jgi:hypothetical protein